MNGIDELLLFLGSNQEEVRGREGEREINLFVLCIYRYRVSGVCTFWR